MLRSVLLALLLAAPALAQELPPLERRPFRLIEPFEPGEVWTTCGGIRTRLARVDGAPFEASIFWTHSATVLARPDGFALRAALTSITTGDRGDHGARVELWRAPETGGPRGWTYELDRDWDLRAIDGPPAAFDRLADQVLRRLGLRPAERPRGRREGAVEEALVAFAGGAGLPVRTVLASARVASLRPGLAWRFERQAGWPGGGVEYLGADGYDQGLFLVRWDRAPGRTLDAQFAVDRAGRLTHFALVEVVEAGRSFRLTRELVHGIVRVHARGGERSGARTW